MLFNMSDVSGQSNYNVLWFWFYDTLLKTTLFIAFSTQVVQAVIVRDVVSEPITYPLLKIASSLLLGSFTGLSRDRHHKQLTLKIFNMVDGLEQLFTFCRHLLPWENFKKDILPLLLNRCQTELLKSSCKFQEVVLMLTEIIVHSTTADSTGLELGSLKGLIFFPKCGTKQGGQILQAFLDNLTIDGDILMDENRLSLIWGTLVCIPCIRWVVEINRTTAFMNTFLQRPYYYYVKHVIGNQACGGIIKQYEGIDYITL